MERWQPVLLAWVLWYQTIVSPINAPHETTVWVPWTPKTTVATREDCLFYEKLYTTAQEIGGNRPSGEYTIKVIYRCLPEGHHPAVPFR
jgi:hypothetical protein